MMIRFAIAVGAIGALLLATYSYRIGRDAGARDLPSSFGRGTFIVCGSDEWPARKDGMCMIEDAPKSQGALYAYPPVRR